MNNNEPLLHFGDDIEGTDNGSQSEQANNHIVFNSTAEEPKQQPAQQPVQQPSAPQPRPQQPVRPVVQPAPQQPSAPQQTSAPQQPVTPQQPRPQQPVQQKKPQKIQNPNEMFGKKNLRITLTVVNGAGVALPKFKIDHKEIMNGQEITFSESRDAYDVTISADGYKDRRIQITHTDLQKGEKRIMLASQLQSIVVSFNTPDGIKRGSVDIDQSNAIYEFIKEASHTDTPLNELQIGGVGGGSKPVTGKVSFMPYLISLAVGLILGIAVTAMFNSCDGDSEKDKTEVVAEEGQAEEMEVKDEEVQPDENAQTLDPQPEKTVEETTEEPKPEEAKAEEPKVESASTMAEADVKYFKEKDKWMRGEPSADDGKRLIAAFCSGNIDYIIGANAYNSVDPSKRNGYYNQVLKDLQKIKTQSNAEDAKAALRDACKDGNVNLRTVLDRIHPMLRK